MRRSLNKTLSGTVCGFLHFTFNTSPSPSTVGYRLCWGCQSPRCRQYRHHDYSMFPVRGQSFDDPPAGTPKPKDWMPQFYMINALILFIGSTQYLFHCDNTRTYQVHWQYHSCFHKSLFLRFEEVLLVWLVCVLLQKSPI